MESGGPIRRQIDVQIAVMTTELTSLRRDVEEIKSTIEHWIENSGRERTAILLAVITGWLGLIGAAMTALLHH